MRNDERFHEDILEQLSEGVYYVDLYRTIHYWNRGAEQIAGYKASEMVGKRCSDNILRHTNDLGVELCKTMCPLAQTMVDGRSRQLQVYLHHKDGHRQPVLMRTAPIRDRSGKIIGAVETFSDATEAIVARQKIEDLQRLALYDPLTNVGNRRFAEMTLRAKLDDLARYGWVAGVLFVDIDQFKHVNDTYGHGAGDEVLRMVAKTLIFSSRPSDAVARWGGEEFMVVIANADSGALASAAERLRSLVDQSSLTWKDSPIKVTVSVGGLLARPDHTMASLVDCADELLYQSKARGRNCVTLALDD